MSVLIEALTLVARRINIEMAHPGGADDFLRLAAARDDVRYAIADDQLIAVSSFEPAAIQYLTEVLGEANLLFSNGDASAEAVVVDMELGPLEPSPWLTVSRHAHGFTTATLAASPSPRLVAPPSWTPAHGWTLVREDLRDAGERNVQNLGCENGKEYVLDYRTGIVHGGFEARSPVQHVEPDTDPTIVPMARSAEVVAGAFRVLTRVGVPFIVDVEHRCVVVPFALDDVDGEDRDDVTPEDRLRVMLRASSTPESVTAVVVLPFFLHEKKNAVRWAGSVEMMETGDPAIDFVAEVDEDTGTMALVTSVARESGQSVEDVVERALTRASGLGTRGVVWTRQTTLRERSSR